MLSRESVQEFHIKTQKIYVDKEISRILQTIFTFLLPGWKDEPPLLPSNLSPQSLISLVPRGSTVVLEHGTSLVQEVLWSTKFLKISSMVQLKEILPTTRLNLPPHPLAKFCVKLSSETNCKDPVQLEVLPQDFPSRMPPLTFTHSRHQPSGKM